MKAAFAPKVSQNMRMAPLGLRASRCRVTHCPLGLLATLVILLSSGCSVEKATLDVQSCSSSLRIGEREPLGQTRTVAGGAAIGQHFTVLRPMTLKKVTFYASSGGMTNFILTIYENFRSGDQMTLSPPVAEFNMAQNFSSFSVAPLEITLPTPVQIKAGIEYMVGFAPNSNISLQWAQIGASSLRGYFRLGSGGNSWGDASFANALSIMLEGDLDCEDR